MKKNKKFIKKIIGKAELLISDKSVGDERYSDGSVEDKMLTFFKGNPTASDVEDILKNNPSWPERYHYSDVRENLLSWYNFKRDTSLLEVGSGCGAITGLFCRSVKSVTAVELTYRRALITAHRHQDCRNLKVISGDIKDADMNEKFDYITSIGVLEYAGIFSESLDPFNEFLETLNSKLKESGTLILAIENKFGLKYWSGCREDHTGRLFDSIEGYSSQKKKQTFGYDELKRLIVSSGFNEPEFYYPMPDYKMPMEIFSDKYLPTLEHNISPSNFPFEDYGGRKVMLFKERMVMDNIIKNKQFPFFANSFLIFATKR